MADKNALQEKYVELQLLSMQIKQLEEQLNVLDQKSQELVILRESLRRLGELKADAKSLAPIGPGIFVPGTVDPTKGVLINVGAGVIVNKSFDEAENTINIQLHQIEDITLELSNNLRAMAEQAQVTELEIDKLS
ncbi:MAG: prefoldin subunit alpha [DPANN group archaeon]|nr:prefoldin subunit alpha [DPANN group archaeon]